MKNNEYSALLILLFSEDYSKAQSKTREEEANLVAKRAPMAKVEKRTRQEEDAKDRTKAAEKDYRQKIELANQKQAEMTEKTSHTTKELQVHSKVLFKNESKFELYFFNLIS